jgi:hypothetical protein
MRCASLLQGESRRSATIPKSRYVLIVRLADRCETESEWTCLSVTRSGIVIHSYELHIIAANSCLKLHKTVTISACVHVHVPVNITQRDCKHGVFCGEALVYIFHPCVISVSQHHTTTRYVHKCNPVCVLKNSTPLPSQSFMKLTNAQQYCFQIFYTKFYATDKKLKRYKPN